MSFNVDSAVLGVYYEYMWISIRDGPLGTTHPPLHFSNAWSAPNQLLLMVILQMIHAYIL
jgi:hypothetical protein